jgi:hypothetical protein
MLNGVDEGWKVDDTEGLKEEIPWQAESVQFGLVNQKSADPVSKITLYATGGVPTVTEPKKLESAS